MTYNISLEYKWTPTQIPCGISLGYEDRFLAIAIDLEWKHVSFFNNSDIVSYTTFNIRSFEYYEI